MFSFWIHKTFLSPSEITDMSAFKLGLSGGDRLSNLLTKGRVLSSADDDENSFSGN